MKHIKLYEEFITPEVNLHAYRKYIAGVKDENKDVNFRWDLNNNQVKIFLDITPFKHQDQDFIGKGIIGWGAIQDWVKRKFKNAKKMRLEKINHVGFIFSDGTVLHATTQGKGVQFERYDAVITDPECYLVYNMGGDEKVIRDLGNKLISKISEKVPTKKCEDCDGTGKVDGEKCEDCKGYGELPKSYDMPGLFRQILPDWMINIFAAEKSEYRFFCSELVSNLLVRSKLMTYNELKRLHENLNKYDEIDPTKLYKFIIERGDPADLIIKDKDGKEKVIKPSESIN